MDEEFARAMRMLPSTPAAERAKARGVLSEMIEVFLAGDNWRGAERIRKQIRRLEDKTLGTCPFKQDVHDDNSLCVCSESQRRECADDI